MEQNRHSSQIIAWTFGYVAVLYAAWTGAWLLEKALEPKLAWITTDAGQFGYWLAMKLLIWILPSVLLIRLAGRTWREVIAPDRLRSALLWGGGTGLALGAIALITKSVGHQPLFSSRLGWLLVSGVLTAPIIEEITFRGAVLGNLLRRYRFLSANTLTAILFLGVHLPGWYFQGRLRAMISAPASGALAIFLLGWVFGLVAFKSKSVTASALTHILNNLFNA